ncbi:MAG: tRNA-guanine transglycosylase [Asgard group archaeon]|nr:tRNA-guanine transglycosylase [Asgard group archaeon]
MVKLYFKHLFPSITEWQEKPFAPWDFNEHVLLSVLSFFETKLLDDDFDLKKELGCEVFMDSGAFVATAMGLQLDPYEVAEMQAMLKSDFIVPLDNVVLLGDSNKEIEYKIEENVRNAEILLDMKPKGSELIGPLQGFTKETIQYSFDKFIDMGIKKFALGGLVFVPDLDENLERIKIAKKITGKHSLHIFGKFLHPELLHHLYDLRVDSVDGYGYIISSRKGLYIIDNKYVSLAELSDDKIKNCSCETCQQYDYQDFLQGNREAQHILIQHNIRALNRLNQNLEKKSG